MSILFYIPGLGDNVVGERQKRYINYYCKKRDMELVFFYPKWHEDELYAQKWARLQSALEKCDLSTTTIVGVSAGGSLAIRALDEFPEIKKAHTVCAKLLNSNGIGQPFRDRAPALYDSVKASDTILASDVKFASKTTTYRPIFDTVVPIKDATFKSARKKRIPLIGHTAAIVWYLAFNLPRK